MFLPELLKAQLSLLDKRRRFLRLWLFVLAFFLLVLTSLSLVGGAIAAPVYDVRFAAVQGDPVGSQTLTVVGSQVVTNNDLGEVVFSGDTLIRIHAHGT